MQRTMGGRRLIGWLAASLLAAACRTEDSHPIGPQGALQLVKVSGDSQPSAPESPAPQPLVVRVVDARGSPVASASVRWTASGGTLSSFDPITDRDGFARAQFTKGCQILPATITASLASSTATTITFVSTWTPGRNAQLIGEFSDGLGYGDAGERAAYIELGDAVTGRARVSELCGAGTFSPKVISWSSSNRAVLDLTETVVGDTATVRLSAISPGRSVLTWSAGDTSARLDVTVASALRNVRVATLGARQGCAIDASAALYCWGEAAKRTSGGFSAIARRISSVSFVDVSSGFEHACAIAVGGEAFCWGSNNLGKLGDGSTTARGELTRVATQERFTMISVGATHSCALAVGGNAYCWGDNSSGQLGDGTIENRFTSTPVSGGLSFKQIAAGNVATCALTVEGTAYCWGGNPASTRVPRPSSSSLRFTSITLNGCGITIDGDGYCGLVGGSSAAPGDQSNPFRIAGDFKFAQLQGYAGSTCGRTTDERIYCWGANRFAQTGAPPSEQVSEPFLVGDSSFHGTLVGGSTTETTCAITAPGELRCFGGGKWAMANPIGLTTCTLDRYQSGPCRRTSAHALVEP